MAKHKYTMEDWRAVRKGLDAGGTIRGVASETGVNRGAVLRWSRGDRPPDWMWLEMEIPESPAAGAGVREPGARLTYEDRCMIHAMLGCGSTHGQIARAVGCDRSTVSREIARMPGGGYDPRAAQLDAEGKARRPKVRKLDANPAAAQLFGESMPRDLNGRDFFAEAVSPEGGHNGLDL